MKSRRVWLAAILALYGALACVQVFWGRFTGDEGFYALAARSVMHGARPYRDFMFMQMPALPYAYAGWYALFGVGIQSGRVFSALLGAGAVALVALACERRAGRWAGIAGGCLLALNLNYVFDTATLKTQPLTVFLTAAAIFVLAQRDPSRPLRVAALGMAMMSLAFLERLSLLPVLPLLWIYLAWLCRSALKAYLALLAGNVIALAAIGAWFWSGGNMIFGVYRFHREYFGSPPWSLAWFGQFVAGWMANEALIVVLFAVAAGFLIRRVLSRSMRAVLAEQAFLCFLFLSYLAVTAVHAINVHSYATHQTSILPFAVVFAVAGLFEGRVGRRVPRSLGEGGSRPTVRPADVPVDSGAIGASQTNGRAGRPTLPFIIAFAVLLLVGLPFQEWEANFHGDRSLGRLDDAARIIEANSGPGDSVLSFNAELAVASGRQVPFGYELSQYSYFPLMSDADCARLKTVNFTRVLNDIKSRKAKIICWGANGVENLTRGNPLPKKDFFDAVLANYVQVGSVPNYGQFGEVMYIFRAM